MPGINGLELAEKLKDHNAKLPVALCTANIQNAIQEKAENLNITFVGKPISNESVAVFLQQAEQSMMDG